MQTLRDATGTLHIPTTGDVRIVSLVPSITELVIDLGLAHQVVGRTGFCVHPRDVVRQIPKVGGTKDVDLDKVRALAPTHVIVNIDENRKETADALREFVANVIVTHPLGPQDNVALYRLIGGIFGKRAEAEELCVRFDAALAETKRTAADFPPERVLYVIWRDPWMTVSRDTYISRTLALVNWHTVPIASAVRYPQLRLDDVTLRNANVVLLSSEPYRFTQKHVAELAAMRELAGKRVMLVDGEMTSWYGSRAIAGLKYLATLRAGRPA